MKAKTTRRILVFLMALLMVVSFTSCEAFILWMAEELLLTDITGKAVNAQATGAETEWWLSGTDSLSGAAISLYAEAADGGFSSAASYTGYLGSTGAYTIYDIAPGRYKISGELTGWTFVPRYADIDGDDMVIPDLIAYRSVNNEVLIFVSWEDTSIDVDGILSYDTDTSPGGRSFITTSTPSYPGYINLDRSVAIPSDTSIPRVETISIADYPNPDVAHYDIAYDPDLLPYNQMRYYVKANGTASLTGVDDGSNSTKAAYAQVDVMYNAVHYGVWELPYNTLEDVLHVVTIDAVDEGSSVSFTIYSAGNAGYGVRSLSPGGAVVVNALK
ncbi:MAG: hypothetical protein JW760_05820 [Spirochaetales bacterium]|nr:hypothetical protein [Spirochaetales bacterium]